MGIVDLKYDYQKEMYAEIKELIDNGKRSLCYVLCMGLGKSYIFLKILEDYFIGKKVLYVCPKLSIAESLRRKPEFVALQGLVDIDTTTFQGFNQLLPKHYKYDGIFIDECHHCISPIQGTHLMRLKQHMEDTPGKYVVGFSATPVFRSPYTRKLVDIRNMFPNTVTGISISEAIYYGLVPKLKYAVAIPDMDKILEEAGKSPKEFREKYSITSTKTVLENIISEYPDVNHWVAFFPNKREMFCNRYQLKKLFPGYHIYEMYSGMKKSTRDVLHKFDTDPGKAILLSINMVLEGVHPSTIGGILLYRNPNENVFAQVIGRLMDIKRVDTQPVFVDIVNAISGLGFLNDIVGYTNIVDGEASEDPTTSNDKTSRKIMVKDIIDVNCSSYRYVQLLEEIVRAMKEKVCVIDGKEYKYVTEKQFAYILGASVNWVYTLRKKGLTDDEIIVAAKEKQNTYMNGTVIVGDKVITYTSCADLSRKLDRCESYVTQQLQKGFTIEQIVENCTTLPRLINNPIHTKIPKNAKLGTVTVDGITIAYKNHKDLSLKLGRYPSYVAVRLRSGKSIQQIVEESFHTKNIKKNRLITIEVDGECFTFKSNVELGRMLGKSGSYVSSRLRNGLSYEEIVCHSKAYDVGTIVVVDGNTYNFRSDSELSKTLGYSRSYVSDLISCGLSYEEIIRKSLKTNRKRISTTVVVDGKTYTFNTGAELARILGHPKEFVYNRRRRGQSYETIIRDAVDRNFR